MVSISTRSGQPSRIRILSLDGGGVRGLSSLLILRNLIRRIERKKGIGITVRPCECFEFIIGTGTGGISALLLGRMRMTVDEAIEAYLHIATSFIPSLTGLSARFRREPIQLDGDVLERTVGDIAERFLSDRDAPLADPSYASCAVAILAAISDYTDAPPYIFRSYASDFHNPTLAIRMIARASAATAGLFPSVELGNPPMRFFNAALAGYNNPAEIGMDEAATLWPGSPVDLLSLGTGMLRVVSVGERWNDISQACHLLVQSCERVHDNVFRRRHRSPEGFQYFRFNVDRGLESIDMMRWDDVSGLPLLTGITETYLLWGEVSHRLDSCARKLAGEDPEGAKQQPNIGRHELNSSAEAHLRQIYEWVVSANAKPILGLVELGNTSSSDSTADDVAQRKNDPEKALQAQAARAEKYQKETEELKKKLAQLRAQLRDAQMASETSKERFRLISTKISVARAALDRHTADTDPFNIDIKDKNNYNSAPVAGISFSGEDEQGDGASPKIPGASEFPESYSVHLQLAPSDLPGLHAS